MVLVHCDFQNVGKGLVCKECAKLHCLTGCIDGVSKQCPACEGIEVLMNATTTPSDAL